MTLPAQQTAPPPVAGAGTRSFSDLMPLVQEMERVRAIAAAKVKKHLLAFAPFFLAALIGPFFLNARISPFILFAPLAILIAIAWFSIPNEVAAFKRRFKNELVHAIIKRFSSELEYFPTRGASQADLMGTLLFNTQPNRFSSEDLVTGIYAGVPVAFSEVRAKRVETKGTGKNRRTETEIIFNGVLFMARFNKRFKSTTLVFPDVAEAAFGKMGQFFQELGAGFVGGGAPAGGKMQLIRLDDPEFEKMFSVYGQDQVEARYILTPSFMQRMYSIGQRKGGKVSISFRENVITLAVSSPADLFEASVSQKVNPEFVGQTIEAIAGYLAIVDELKLNQQLWAQ